MGDSKTVAPAIALILCCMCSSFANALQSDQRQPDTLDLHTGVQVDEVLRLLGPPSDRIQGYPRTYGDVQRQLVEMGIETLVYATRGIEVMARKTKVFSVSVRAPFIGTYHGVRIGTHFSEVQRVRGNPDQTYFGPGAKRNTYKSGEVWNWGVTESNAGYYISSTPDHLVVFKIELNTGNVHEISETDSRIRGAFFIVPGVK